MPPRKKKQEVVDESIQEEQPKKVIQEVSINDLFECLKEFDNKVLLERLKVLERTVTLLYKEQVGTKNSLKELQQAVVNLSLTYEELLHSLGVTSSEEENVSDEEAEKAMAKESEIVAVKQVKAGKKWN